MGLATGGAAAVVMPTGAAASFPRSRPAGLDADLAKSESQLADWVHCVSAKTPEGKAKIVQIQTRIDAIKSKMQQAETVAAAQDKARHAADAPSVAAADPLAANSRPALSGLGGRLNLYA